MTSSDRFLASTSGPAAGATGSTGPEREELLADVAEMYYKEGQDQVRIANRIGLSRSNVSRLLTEARNRGIVQFTIRRTLARNADLEMELVRRFGLREARVLDMVPGLMAEQALMRIGSLGASALLDVLPGADVVGISWGESVRAVVTAVDPDRPYPVDVVQLLGGAWISPELSGDHLGRQLATTLGGSFTALHAPATMVAPGLARDLLSQPGVAEVLVKGARADVALVGIGSPSAGSTQALLSAAGLATPAHRQEIDGAGAVGVVCGRLYTLAGETCDLSFNGQIAAIDLDSLRSMQRVIGVARGVEKADAIVGALRGGLVDILVTDAPTATAVLD